MSGQPGVWFRGILWGLGATLALTAAAAAAEAAGGHGGMDPAKIQDFTWRSVNFVIFAAALVYLLRKPMKAFFSKRSQDIGMSLDELEAKKAEAAKALKEAEARLAEVSAEREKIIQQYLAEGEVEKARIIEKAEMVAARLKEMAAFAIEQETKKAAQELKQEVVDLAAGLAEDLIKEKVTYADQQKLVEEYLKKVVEAH